MCCFDDIGIYRYEVASIINGYRDTIAATNDLEAAKIYFNANINKFANSTDHVILFIYDYDKNTNIEYYDGDTELC